MPWIWVDNDYGTQRRRSRTTYSRRYRRSYARSYDDEDRYDADEADDDMEDDIYDDGDDDQSDGFDGNYTLRSARRVTGRNGRQAMELTIASPSDMLPPDDARSGYAPRARRYRF
jgi:hypothetical protein